MKYVFTLIFLLLMSGILRAEQNSLAPKPVPAPTTPRVVMVIEQDESLSSKSAKDELRDLAAELKQDKEIVAYVISFEKSARSREASRMANQIKNYLVKKKGINSDRIVVVNGGNSDIWKVKIFLVPPAKRIEDSIEQTLDASEVLNYGTDEKAISSGIHYDQPIKCLTNDPFSDI